MNRIYFFQASLNLHLSKKKKFIFINILIQIGQSSKSLSFSRESRRATVILETHTI